MILNGPVKGQAYLALRGPLMQSLQEHGIGEEFRIEPLSMEQAG